MNTKTILAEHLRPHDMIKTDTESPKFSEVISTLEDPDRYGYPMVTIEVTRLAYSMHITIPPKFPVEVAV